MSRSGAVPASRRAGDGRPRLAGFAFSKTLAFLAAALLTGAPVPSALAPGRAWAALPAEPTNLPARTPSIGLASSLTDVTGRLDVNQLDMRLTNIGSFAYNLLDGGAGLFYPKGTTRAVVYASGIWVGARVGGEERIAVAEYDQEFVPGPMSGGGHQADRLEFRNYEILSGNTGSYDYLNWPADQGAPLDLFGNPEVLGDDTVWSVYNDAAPGNHFLSAPLGLEIQQTTFAFNQAGPMGRTVLLRFKLINKGANTLEDAYASIWGDPDVGGAGDDLAGCDVPQSLGFCYNADNDDPPYGSQPPAVGYYLYRGPIVNAGGGVQDTLGLTSFVRWLTPATPTSAAQAYSYMRGLNRDGVPIHEMDDPNLPITTYMVSGDPVSGAGWIDAAPGDLRLLITSGPFRMEPGDSQELIVAIVVGHGSDRLASISELKASIPAVRDALDELFGPRPVVSVPSSVTADEGEAVAFPITVEVPGGGLATLTTAGLPTGATALDHGDNTGSFAWTPSFDQAGTHRVVFIGAAASGRSGGASTIFTVRNVNRPPVAEAGGPYVGPIDLPIQFDGSASVDPDGTSLAFTWEFGDGAAGSGEAPAHRYAAAGVYGVRLTVTDGTLSDASTTTATATGVFAARAFLDGGSRSIRLSSGKPTWCLQLEPIGRSYANSEVNLASIVMRSQGTGSVGEIGAISGKTVVESDRDGNGVAEITVCFSKDELRQLFDGVTGHQSVPVTVEAARITGGTIRAQLDILVIGGGGGLAARLAPNPPGREAATLTFTTSRAGYARVRMFDSRGRLVRTLLEAVGELPDGRHVIPVDGRDRDGNPLASGVYFYRVDTAEGAVSGRFALLR